MKKLILVRHATSALPNMPMEDYNRPLKKNGIEDSKQIGQYLKAKQYIPDYIITSGAKRTLETADNISKQLFNQSIPINKNRIIYGASIIEMIELIHNFNNQYNIAMIVGHNPTMTLLNNKITNVTFDHIPTAGTSIINYKINRWNELNREGELVEFINPKKLQQL